MSERKPQVLIVEDDADMARLNRRLLVRHGCDAAVAFTAGEALDAARENPPDLFVLDIELPDGDGLTLCETLRRDTDAPILFLTGRNNAGDLVKGLDMGGDYYLTKPCDRQEFIAVVQSLLRRAEQARKKLAEASVVARGPLTLILSEDRAYLHGRDVDLTKKEFGLLLTLVRNEDKTLTAEQLYESVWKTPMNNNSGSIRTHIYNLKKKLDEENTDEFAMLYEQGKGYVFTTS